ncbi:MAG: hypothetical protein JO253_02540 [Alphaproteobacteria bacterium]|nr:hypothetical protein [Alphaproteobacteria bacterium]
MTVLLKTPANQPGEKPQSTKEVELPRPRFAARLVNAAPIINLRELTSIKALTAFVSHNQNIREETVRALVSAQFNVPAIEQLNRKDYDDVVRFLVDLRVEMEMG